MTSTTSAVDLQHFTDQAQALSAEHQRVLSALHSALNANVTRTVQEISHQASHDVKENKQQIKNAVEELDKALKRKCARLLMTVFSSLQDSLKDNDLTSFNVETWISTNMHSLEESLGSQCIPSHKVLNLVNDLSSLWTEKVEKLKASGTGGQGNRGDRSPSRHNEGDEPKSAKEHIGKDFEEISEKSTKSAAGKVEMKTEGRIKSETNATIGGADAKSSIIGRMKGLFKTGSSQEVVPVKANLGNEKNFKWDPIKKRYIFDDDEDVPEEKDEGPPPMMGGSKPAAKPEEEVKKAESDKKPEEGPEEKKKYDAKSLLAPTAHRALSRKKEQGKKPAGGAPEQKKPAFVPSMFVPAAAADEKGEGAGQIEERKVGGHDDNEEDVGKSAMGEEILKKIEHIFESLEASQSKAWDFKKFKSVFESVENMVGREMRQKLEKEMEVILLQKELESSAENIIKEANRKKALETEVSILRNRLEKTSGNEGELKSKLVNLEKELEMFKEVCSSKSEVLELVHQSDYHEKITEAHFKSLQEANEQKRKALEARNEVRELEMKLCEKEMDAKVWEERYKEVLRQNEEGKKLPGKLRAIIEEYMKVQMEQDDVIVKLKQENCEVLKQYKRAFEELGKMAEEHVKSGEEIRHKKQEIAGLERKLKDKQKQLDEKEDASKEVEQVVKGREEKIDELERRLEEAQEERRQLERTKERENDQLRKEIEDLNEKVGEILGEKDELVREKEQVILEKEKIIREKEDVEEQREQKIRENEELLVEKKSLENEREMLEKEKFALQEQKEDQLKEIQGLYRDKTELIEEKERIYKEKEAIAREKDMFSREKDASERFGEELTRKNLVLEGKIQESETEMKRLRSERSKWSEGLLEFVKGLEQGEDAQEISTRDIGEVQLFRGVREYMEESLAECKDEEVVLRLMGVLEKVKECLESKIQSERTLRELERAELQVRIESLEKEKALMEEEGNIVKGDAERLKESLNEEKEMIEHLKERVAELERQHRAKEIHAEDLEAKAFHLEQELANKISQEENITNRLREMDTNEARLVEELQEKVREVERIGEELILRGNEYVELKNNYEAQIEKMKEESEDFQGQLDEGFKQYEFLQGKTKDTMEQLRQATEDNEALKQDIEQLRLELASKEEVDGQNNGLRDEIAGLNERIAIISEELQVKENAVAELRAQIESSGGNAVLSEDVEALRQQIEHLSHALEEKDEALLQREQEREQFESRFHEEREDITKRRDLLEETITILEDRIRVLEGEAHMAKEESDRLRVEVARKEEIISMNTTTVASDSQDGVDGEKLCASLERVYGESPIFNALAVFVEQMREEKNVTAFKACLDIVGHLEEVFERLNKEINDKTLKVGSLTRLLEEEEAKKSEVKEVKEDITATTVAATTVVEGENEREKQLEKEIEDKKKEIEELGNEVVKLRKELEEWEQDTPEQTGGKKKEPTIKDLKKEIKREQDKAKKMFEEAEAAKKMLRHIDEERGSIQKSYAQIIRNLGQEIDDLKRKKGIPIAVKVTKSVQTEEEEKKPVEQPVEVAEKKAGFLSGMAKYFMSEKEDEDKAASS